MSDTVVADYHRSPCRAVAPAANQIDYTDEKPIVRQMFAEALAKHGMISRMDPVYEAELPNLPPKTA